MGADRSGRTPSAEIVDEAELADSQGFSFGSSKNKDNGAVKAPESAADVADSKYADPKFKPSKRPTRPTAPSSARQMPPRKAPASPSSSDSFIDLDSTDDNSDADDIGLPTIVSPQKAGGGASKGNKLSSKDRSDFWASKATASAGASPQVYPDDEEEL
jgi:hypothetical protein